MFICPWDLEPCRRAACHGGICERTADLTLFMCWECGGMDQTSSNARMCAECLHAHAPVIEEGA
jgi:hypothetical protein